ncbi:hypothetical protein ACJIZ3_020090 [Penstemon smallii]|uniref:CLAVATA3/ESR (CLE)-related protein 13 n=1 Tax=Penstemon smallii TaxID=265156 RepID=A0ABD3SHL8_9LAMI
MRIPPLFYTLIIWLFLLLLFHGLYNFKHIKIINLSPSTLITHRKTQASKVDFTLFLKLHHHHRHRKLPTNVHTQSGRPIGNEIDPRFGVEKRLVPSGPNPLHH